MAHGGYPIRLITVGRPKLAPVRELEAHYQGLLKAFARLTVVELPEGRGDTARQLQEEAERIRPQLLASRCPVRCRNRPPMTSSSYWASC